tara:strand:+ start:5592 stop:6143 length:552 start_codon:yes stop_codon:yes gene_type:complete
MKLNTPFLILFSLILLSLNNDSMVRTFAQEVTETPAKTDAESDDSAKEVDQPEDETLETTVPKKDKTQRNETLQRILERLESLSRDPFAPSDQISREQLKKNNQFVPVTENTILPEIELVSYAESDTETLAGLKINDKIYFVRIDDQVTIRHSSKNLVIRIQAIDNGHVEVQVGELTETIIVW